MAAAAHRRDMMLLAGGREGYERGYRFATAEPEGVGFASTYVDATKPEQAILYLFDDLLKEGFIEAADFEPQVERLPLYKLHSQKTNHTLPWVGQFLSTKYLRIKYPEGLPDLPEDEGVVWEFAVKAHGGRDASSVVRSIGEGLQW
jgi:hypothetical protein